MVAAAPVVAVVPGAVVLVAVAVAAAEAEAEAVPMMIFGDNTMAAAVVTAVLGVPAVTVVMAVPVLMVVPVAEEGVPWRLLRKAV